MIESMNYLENLFLIGILASALPVREIYRPPQQEQPLVTPPSSSWEGVGCKQSIRVPGTWPEIYFLIGLVMGTEAAVQIQGSHRLTKKHRGQGLTKPREPWCKRSHTADELLPCWQGTADGARDEEEAEKAGPASSRDLSEGSFSSTPGLQRPVRAAMRQAAPSSHSGAPLHGARTQFPLRPRGLLCAGLHKKVSLLSKSSDDTINSGSLLCLRTRCIINDR